MYIYTERNGQAQRLCLKRWYETVTISIYIYIERERERERETEREEEKKF